MRPRRSALPPVLICVLALLLGTVARAQGGVDLGLVGAFRSMEADVKALSARDLLPPTPAKARSAGVIAACPEYALAPQAAVQQSPQLIGRPGRAAQRHLLATRDPDGVYPLPNSWAAYTVTRR